MPHNLLEMPAELRAAFGDDAFDAVMQLDGEVFRDVPGRKTIRVDIDGSSCFVKQHFGVGWREVFKNLFSLRLPIVSARTEWQAIRRLDAIGIPTTPALAFGERGCDPSRRQSFVITRDLGDIVSLEDFCRDWPQSPPPPRLRRRLVVAAAQLARRLHDHGFNHRDFYICHLCLDRPRLAQDDIHLYLIDLHRVGMHRRISETARLKDMAALYFSALDIGLTRRDCLRFLRAYRQRPLRETLRKERRFWRKVADRAARLYHKFHGRMPASIFQPQG